MAKFCSECGSSLGSIKLGAGLPTNMGNRQRKPKRKLSAWNKFVKANSSKKIYKYANGKLKLKKMGIAFRKTPAGRKK